MPAFLEKLQFKGYKNVLVKNVPADVSIEVEGAFEDELQKMSAIDFALVFVTKQAEVDAISAELITKAKDRGDVAIWFAYPKGTSKKYKCDFHRDTGWSVLKAAGYDSVRIVSVDADWSALRFRKVEYIKSSK